MLKDCTKPVKSAAYTSMARPTMEYASSVLKYIWNIFESLASPAVRRHKLYILYIGSGPRDPW
jgi:hypothetical protein